MTDRNEIFFSLGAALQALHLAQAIGGYLFQHCQSISRCLESLSSTDDITQIGLATAGLLLWLTIRQGL